MSSWTYTNRRDRKTRARVRNTNRLHVVSPRRARPRYFACGVRFFRVKRTHPPRASLGGTSSRMHGAPVINYADRVRGFSSLGGNPPPGSTKRSVSRDLTFGTTYP